jgi:SAM-dependent methyltransferase
MRASLKAALPVAARRTLRGVRLRIWSLLDSLRPDRLVPVGAEGLVGQGDFVAVGEEFLHHFRDLGGLVPADRVLDIGCGVGRMAVPLTRYLDGGTYRGFDVVEQMVHSCERRIGARFPEFRFDHIDVFNGKYNPGGAIPPDEVRFPYDDDAFDFAFATSVFTHLLPDDAARYLAETARVLRPEGRSLVTWYVVTPETAVLVEERRSRIAFVSADEGIWLLDAKEPEAAVGYDEALVRRLYAGAGMAIDTVAYGSWRGEPGTSTQDIVVATTAT